MKKLLLVLPFAVLTACDEHVAYPGQLEHQAAEAATTAPTPVDSILLTNAASVNGGKFTVVGDVKATVAKATVFHPSPTAEQAEKKLRIEAAKLNADAVTNVKIGATEICPFSWGCRHATGTAVQFTQ